MVVFKKQKWVAFVSETGQTLQTHPVTIHYQKNTVQFCVREGWVNSFQKRSLTIM